MGVMLQAFYWDCPREDHKEFQWWNTVREQIPSLAKIGLHRALAAAGPQGRQPRRAFDGLRSVRLLRPRRVRPEGRRSPPGSAPRQELLALIAGGAPEPA